MKTKIKVMLDPGAELPRFAHSTDVGADVKALNTWLVQGDGTEHQLASVDDCLRMRRLQVDCAKIKIDTGVHVCPAPGYYVELAPNSRIAKTPFVYANSFGVIDPEYTGSMRVILNCVNRITPEDLQRFLPGNVVGQLIVRRRHEVEFVHVDSLEKTERGDGGFGSTANEAQTPETCTSSKCLSCKHFIGANMFGGHPDECGAIGTAPEDRSGCEHYKARTDESLVDLMFPGVKKCSTECPHFHPVEDAPEGMEHCGFCDKNPDPYPHCIEIGWHCIHDIIDSCPETEKNGQA